MKKLVILFLLMFAPLTLSAAEPLRIGVLLIEDIVPLYVAEQDGFFASEGVNVELVPFQSALERDSALTAGAIDGGISDPVGAIQLDRGRGIVQITSLCLGETPKEGVFAILAAPESDLHDVEDLKNVKIAVSNGTIIEYVTERMLQEQGFTADEIKTIEVKKMPIRMQMLLSNSVSAATLPEPLASIAAAKGGRILLSDEQSTASLSQTVLVFRSDVLKKRKDEVKAFFRALTRGVAAINNAPESYRKLFVAKGRIPSFLAEQYVIPRYPLPRPFNRTMYEQVTSWLLNKNLTQPIPYETMVATDVFVE